MVNIREIDHKDIPILTEICRLGMELDVWYEDLVREKTVDARDFDPSLGMVAEEDGTPVGFAQGVLGKAQHEGRGWIRLLVVHPAWRCRGIGSLLLREMEKRLMTRGTRTISIMDVPANYQMPGVDVRYREAFCFLPKHDYQRGLPNVNLICDLGPEMFGCEKDIKDLSQQDFIIRRAREEDWPGIETFLAANWVSWIDEVRSSFQNDPKTLYICLHKGAVVGFSGYEGNNRKMGWFGPMGVLPVTRGKGIGAIVCLLCLRDLYLAGHRKAIIPWVGPVRFYDKVCRARIDRLFWTYTKTVG